jgi:hypothetical protein
MQKDEHESKHTEEAGSLASKALTSPLIFSSFDFFKTANETRKRLSMFRNSVSSTYQ